MKTGKSSLKYSFLKNLNFLSADSYAWKISPAQNLEKEMGRCETFL